MIPSDVVMKNTFYLQVGEKSGTCFAICFNGEKYLVTAKHIFKDAGFPSRIEIGIERNRIINSYSSKVYYHDNSDVDVSVMTNSFLGDINPPAITEHHPGIVIGKEMCFVGFPFGMRSGHEINNNGYPIPFVKYGKLSAANRERGYPQIWLDGHNNPGFSGAPVMFNEIINNEERQFFCGVISGYHIEQKVVYDGNNKETEYYSRENSGIIDVTGIKCVVDIINEIQ